MTNHGTIIICERTGSWAAALRLAFTRAAAPRNSDAKPTSESSAVAAQPPRLIETRSADECLESLTATPQALAVIELASQNCEASVALIRRIAERGTDTPIVVLAARELAEHEWLARELGAIHFTTSPRHLAAVVEIAERHWARLPAARATIAETIWASLPWGPAG